MVLHDKDKIHILEGAVITWTRQIKDVLKADSESALKVCKAAHLLHTAPGRFQLLWAHGLLCSHAFLAHLAIHCDESLQLDPESLS